MGSASSSPQITLWTLLGLACFARFQISSQKKRSLTTVAISPQFVYLFGTDVLFS